jgi:hypothetical protein
MTSHYITIHSGSGSDKKVSVANYIKAIRFAKSHPEQMFNEGLCQWFPVSGKEIYRDYVKSIYERMWTKGGQSWRNEITEKERQEERDARKLNGRFVIHQLESKSAKMRFSDRICDYRDY